MTILAFLSAISEAAFSISCMKHVMHASQPRDSPIIGRPEHYFLYVILWFSWLQQKFAAAQLYKNAPTT